MALVSVFLAIIVTVGLTALTTSDLMQKVLSWFNLEDAPGVTLALKIVTQLLSLGISWLLFSWMIARLPRESLSLRSAGKAGLLAAIGFEVFKHVASIYLSRITHGPAGATFGPVLGLLVFAYITARMILFATAWAATSTENLALAPVAAPGPATIEPRDFGDEGARARTAVVAGIVGALAALGLSRLRRRRD
jgi:membrane protein